MMRNMVASLLEHERIRTTDTRAKELRRVAEKLVTVGKRALRSSFPDDLPEESYAQKRLHQYRQILRVVKDKDLARKVIDTYAERYSERPGGYTRILKLGRRQGDNAPISIIEFVDREGDSDAE